MGLLKKFKDFILIEEEITDDEEKEDEEVIVGEPVAFNESIVQKEESPIEEKVEEIIRNEESFITLNKKEEEIKVETKVTFEPKQPQVASVYRPTKILSPIFGVVNKDSEPQIISERKSSYVSKTIVSPVYGSMNYKVETINKQEEEKINSIAKNEVEEEKVEEVNEVILNTEVKPTAKPFDEIVPEQLKEFEQPVEKKVEDYENISIFDL